VVKRGKEPHGASDVLPRVGARAPRHVLELFVVGRGEVAVAADGSVNVTMLSEHGGIRTDSTYDSRGNLVEQSEGFADAFEGPQTLRTTRFTYDSLDRLQRVTDPEGFSTITAHDAYGNVLSITRGAYLPKEGDAGYDAAKASVAEPRSEGLRDAVANGLQNWGEKQRALPANAGGAPF
jgi:hypothetical protein